MGDVQDCQVSQLGDIPADLGKPVVSKMEPLQRVHPAVGTANGQICQLVHGAVQLNLERGEFTNSHI